jgi:hypothetical protein
MGLTDFPKSGVAMAPLAPPGTTGLEFQKLPKTLLWDSVKLFLMLLGVRPELGAESPLHSISVFKKQFEMFTIGQFLIMYIMFIFIFIFLISG